jgi:hypothetical protein
MATLTISTAAILFLGSNLVAFNFANMLNGLPTANAALQVTVGHNSAATYLHRSPSDPAPSSIPVNLAGQGFDSGDKLKITFTGTWRFVCGNSGTTQTPERTSLAGVFSSSSTLLHFSAAHRVPGAIDAGSDIDAGNTFFGNEPTDIPEDFRIQPHTGFEIIVPNGATHIFFSVLDSHYIDNCGTITITMELVDEPPVIDVPADITAEATSANGAQVSYEVSANDDVDGSATLNADGTTTQDNVGGDITISCTPASGSTFQIGKTTVQCTATDGANNIGRASFTVTVNPDTAAPVINVPENMVVEATSADGAEVSFEVTAEDNVDGIATLEEDGITITQDDVGGDINISCTPASGSTFQIGETTVECTATDATGNTGTSSFTVTIQDTTPPAISVPGDITEEATGPNGAVVSFDVSAQDLVDGPVSVSCDYNSGDTFPLGETTVTCSAQDSRGNSAQGSFVIEVVDTTAPDVEITRAEDRSGKEISDGGTTAIPYIRITFAATDAVGVESIECSLDGGAFTSCTSPKVYDRLSRGTHEVTVRATDAAGNTGVDEFSWTVGAPPSSPRPAAAPSQEQQQQPAATNEEEEDTTAAVEEEGTVEGGNGGSSTDDSGEPPAAAPQEQQQPDEVEEEGGGEDTTGGGGEEEGETPSSTTTEEEASPTSDDTGGE